MMKKHYLLGLALSAAVSANSQVTIDFESTIIATETYNNGSDLSGGFTYGDVHFSNYYDTTFNYNTGFSISNKTDVSTAGYTNQYSGFAGSGYNSSNYAIFYPDGEIDMNPSVPKYVLSAKITNTTYAALSMLNGDAVGKKFGDSLNAQGANDGTNGEDFYILTIYGRTISGDTTGSVEVVLADYRFADSTQDYVLQDWLFVDLQALNSVVGNVDYLSFSFTSSDNGTWGINTPTYFALDDFEYVPGIFGLNELETEISMYPNPVLNQLNISNASGLVRINDASGKMIYSDKIDGASQIDFSSFQSGIYFVSIESQQGTFTKKIIK